MASRTADSSQWYLPLVAGVEVLARSTNVSLPSRDLLPDMPEPPPWLLVGCQLWLDAGSTSTVKAFPDSYLVYKWQDRSGNNRSATRANPFQPFKFLPEVGGSFTPQSVLFEDLP